jgi:hypothetical protein
MPDAIVLDAYSTANSGLAPGYQTVRSRIDSATPAPSPPSSAAPTPQRRYSRIAKTTSTDEPHEHAGEQPGAVDDALEAGQRRLDGRAERVGREVPDPEHDPGGHGQHGGDDDVDGAPLQ